VEDVEPTDHSFGRRPAGATPERAHRVRARDHRQPRRDRDAVERPLDLALPRGARRSEGHELVDAVRRRRHPEQRSSDV